MAKHELWTKAWWEAALVRAIRTMAQVFVGMVGTAVVISEVDWLHVASATVLSGVLSVASAIGGLPEVDEPHREEYLQ